MTKEEIAELIGSLPQGLDADEFIYKLVNWAIDIERKAVLDTINELMGMERDRHAMFSEGYDYALWHIEKFIQARKKK
jgi:hypothetical protein